MQAPRLAADVDFRIPDRLLPRLEGLEECLEESVLSYAVVPTLYDAPSDILGGAPDRDGAPAILDDLLRAARELLAHRPVPSCSDEGPTRAIPAEAYSAARPQTAHQISTLEAILVWVAPAFV